METEKIDEYVEDYTDGNDGGFVFNSIAELQNYNSNLVDTNIHLIGDRTIIGEIVQLITYIRHGLVNNVKNDITVHLNNTVSNPVIKMDVNGMQVPDLTIKFDVNVN